VHAIDSKLGNAPLDGALFAALDQPHSRLAAAEPWTVFFMALLRAWVDPQSTPPAKATKADTETPLALLRERLAACGHSGLLAQLDAAAALREGRSAATPFFVSGGGEAWRNVLATLMSLGGAAPQGKGSGNTRLIWSVQLGKRGEVLAVEPLESREGARGWGKPARWGGAAHRIDRAAAIVALIGHPSVVLADQPGVMVDVVEGAAQIEVHREADRFVLSVLPQPHRLAAHRMQSGNDLDQLRRLLAERGVDLGDVSDDDDDDTDADDEADLDDDPVEGTRSQSDDDVLIVPGADAKELAALADITVLRDSPQRIRVIRLTAAQRRAAQLVAGHFSLPASAQEELSQALNALAAHFQIHADHVQAAREVTADARLRAELSPVGEGLALRLVAAPLGEAGPRLAPGRGRRRVLATIDGETVGSQRDLAAEQQQLDAVLSAFEFLDPPAPGDLACDWTLADPEQALALVEGLPALPAVAALDWPRGKPVRVVTVDARGLSVSVQSARDWFSLSGRARIDDNLVLSLQDLLAAAGKRSRFVPIGDGVYAALTRELRDKLAALSAVAQRDSTDLRVPMVAADWLEQTLAGTEMQADAAFSARIDTLRRALDTSPALPPGLEAQLRPYQEDGYQWATRLAQAGFGACLADDMGLGKTVQTLALLLARAEGGPALVVAPTSVCGNWLAETRRFAPSLNPSVYGEGDRAALLDAAGARDVVIVSYALMQQAQAAFAARTWHTLVADEAQAVKNAAAKRSQALFDLPSDFRIALSGTPVENRLSELWSIMRFCNPGLLGSSTQFGERFAGPIERNRDRDAQRLLRRLIAPFVLRRTKAQVLSDLPPRTELVLNVVPEAAESAHYEALRRAAVAAAESAAHSAPTGQAQMHILAQLTRLRRAACDPRLVSPELPLPGAKVRAFAELAAELVDNGHKALVFSQFVDFLTLLRAPLDEAGIRYQYLDGATPAAERTRRVAAFQAGEGELFLISLKAGGFGLNLTAADYVVITDPWWNPAAEDQAMGRAHRIGQLRPVTVYRLVSQGTLEERIVELHHDKRALAEGVLAESGESAALPSASELIALMRGELPPHLPPQLPEMPEAA
jgi:superfamily II DNA or RNA helicase